MPGRAAVSDTDTTCNTVYEYVFFLVSRIECRTEGNPLKFSYILTGRQGLQIIYRGDFNKDFGVEFKTIARGHWRALFIASRLHCLYGDEHRCTPASKPPNSSNSWHGLLFHAQNLNLQHDRESMWRSSHKTQRVAVIHAHVYHM